MTERSNAVLLLNLPPASLAGIDVLSFTTSPRFRGLKDVPNGLHFIFTGASNAFSVRHGLWFDIRGDKQAPGLFISKWQDEDDSFVTESDTAEHLRWRANIGEFWREGLAPYRQQANDKNESNDDWATLISAVTPSLLSHITGGDPQHWSLTSASSTARDRDEIPGIRREDFDGPTGTIELHLLPINLKQTWREGATGRERTDAALDRSWALEALIAVNTADTRAADVVGELQFCFLMTLTLNNWSCFEQWKRILTLIFTCKSAVRTRPNFFVQFIAALRLQLQHIKDAEGGLIDMADEGGSLLKGLLVRFRKGITEGTTIDSQDVIDELDDLEAFLKEEYNWQFGGSFVKSGVLELEDGEQVRMDTTDFDEDDETGEYAPQVVDLSPEQARMLYPGDETSLVDRLAASDITEDPKPTHATLHSHTAEVDSSEISDESEMEGDLDDMDERY